MARTSTRARTRQRNHSTSGPRPRRLSPSRRRSPNAATEGNSTTERLSDEVNPLHTSSEGTDNSSRVSSAQTKVSSLCYDRDYWRNRSLQQETRIETLECENKSQSHTIATLKSINANLDATLTDALATGKQLLQQYRDVTSKNEFLTFTAMRLKKSDRAKGKVQQRNLRLKAHINAHHCAEKGKEDALLEALALANEWIEGLQTAGEKLLDALAEKDASEDGEGEESAGERATQVMEAGLTFRGMIDDESFKEQQALWEDLLEG